MDPLAQLKDIHLPAQIHDYPIAPGWWILATVLLALIVYGVIKFRQRAQRHRARKLALAQLKIQTDSQSIIALLKWAALQYFPREQVANLTGQAFQYFLQQNLAEKHQRDFEEKTSDYFAQQYQQQPEQEDLSELKQAAQLWLNHALPPTMEKTVTEQTSTAPLTPVQQTQEASK